ncbi:ER-to-golgi transport membrane protein [Amanita rubescens]|nr:ER-to-golgi transport membrane protein [Amanita rubescens]
MLGTILKVALLLINSIAVLNEERFLARIGWLSTPQQPRDTNSVYQAYDQSSYGATQDVGIKARLIDLISAVRTLMRIPLIIINIIVIIYELLLGG